MLEVKNIHAAYGKVNVLRGIDLHLEEGEIVAVLGSNGAGKTTLNHNLCGLYCPVEGSVKFSGMDITGWRPEKIVEMGMIQIPEGRRLFPNLSVLENLEMGSYKRGKASRTQNLERVFEIFPRLKERREQLAGTLSGGEQQMAAIGRSLMADPKLMIFDEPSLGLSPILVEEMFQLIADINRQGMTILLVEQNTKMALQAAKYGYVLELGAVRIEGEAGNLAADKSLAEAYLGD